MTPEELDGIREELESIRDYCNTDVIDKALIAYDEQARELADALLASNEAGFASMSPGEVIRHQAAINDEQAREIERLRGELDAHDLAEQSK